MQLLLDTAPDLEPVSLTELMTHLRIDEYDSDSGVDLQSIIESSREIVEDYTSRKLVTQTWNYYFNAFPCNNYFKIPFGNLQSVTYLKYTDSDGTVTTMDANKDYIVEKNGDQCGKIVLPYGVSWPSFTPYSSNPINIKFVCGWEYDSEGIYSIPIKYKQAIKLICGDLYVNREGQILSGENYRVNNTVMNLLSSCVLRDTFL
jgi:uncharacterized phiE125 gp8 family phage protein